MLFLTDVNASIGVILMVVAILLLVVGIAALVALEIFGEHEDNVVAQRFVHRN